MSDQVTEPMHVPLGVRPLVAKPINNRGIWLFGAAGALGAIALFASLEAKRADQTNALTSPRRVGGEGMIAPPPPLTIPDAPADASLAAGPIGAWPAPIVAQPPLIPQSAAQPQRRAGRSSYTYPPPSQAGLPPYYGQAGAAPPVPSGPALVYQAPSAAPAADASPDGRANLRVKAAHFDNPSTTIPQGTVIQAVLETALDSNRPGAVRAIVSRDVRSFDGTKVLIPRGSRLYGEYKADLSSGQNRAMIQWTRLMRPDGVVIALDSPSADPLGRAGVKGKVNSHFVRRFGDAFLQSTLNLWAGLASRGLGGGTIILGLPGSTQNVAPTGDSVKSTLTVAQGTPVSVFVARDLDFTGVEQ